MKIVRNSLTKKKHIDDSSLFVVFDVKKKKMIKSTNLLWLRRCSQFIASLMRPCHKGTLSCQVIFVKIMSELFFLYFTTEG